MIRLLFILLVALSGCAHRDTLVQYSTINALLAGVYDGELTFGELRRHGDFGLGTFNALDGEMIALDGRYYQITADGSVNRVADTMRTPFAAVTHFEPTILHDATGIASFHELEKLLDAQLPDKNAFYAIKLTGRFAFVKARSVPRQAPPYSPLVEVVKHQTTFDFRDVTGTFVGFRTPDLARGLNVTGYHFHFLTADRRAGGHVLDCALQAGKIEIDRVNRFLTILPTSDVVGTADIARERNAELETVEKGNEIGASPR